MALRINKLLLFRLKKINMRSILSLSNMNKGCILNFHNSHHTGNLLIIKPSLKYFKRNYSLQLYSHYHPGREMYSNVIIDYMKMKNNLQYDSELYIANVFDKESAVKQFQSIVLHSLDPQPHDVIKLFSLYKTCNRSSLHYTYDLKETSNMLQFKIQSAILQMTFEQLFQFSFILKDLLDLSIKFFYVLAKYTFDESLTRAESLESVSDILKHFLIGMELFGNSVSRKIGYNEYIALFEKYIDGANPSELAQVLYIIGLTKAEKLNTDLPLHITKQLASQLDNISFIDVGLAVNALYRLNKKFETDVPLVSQVSSKLLDEIDPITSTVTLSSLQSFALVSIVKYLRFSMHKNYDLLQAMKKYFHHINAESCNPQLVSHILALYANSDIYESDIYSSLGDIFFKYLRSSDEVVRIKDISRVMWSLSHGQHHLKEDDVNLIIKNLLQFSETGELLTHASHVIDSTLALASLNIYSKELLRAVLNKNVFNSIKEQERSRYLSRLCILNEVQKSIFPELPQTLPQVHPNDLPQRKISQECHYRPCINRIRIAISWLKKECGSDIFSLEFLIPHIHYCSVVLMGKAPIDVNIASDIGKRVLDNLSSFNDFKVAIDIDDANTSLYDGERPNGMEVLKRNLLEKQGWKVKVLSSKDVEVCGDDDQALAALLLQTALN